MASYQIHKFIHKDCRYLSLDIFQRRYCLNKKIIKNKYFIQNVNQTPQSLSGKTITFEIIMTHAQTEFTCKKVGIFNRLKDIQITSKTKLIINLIKQQIQLKIFHFCIYFIGIIINEPHQSFQIQYSKIVDNYNQMQHSKAEENIRFDTQKMIQSQIKIANKSDKENSKLNDSKILLNDIEGQEKIAYLLKQLGNPSELKLLFRASEHDYQAIKFHEHCDSFLKTVTIIRTEFNRTIAAYTPIKWKSAGNYIPDHSCQTFLLQLQLKEKMTLIKGKEQFAVFDYYHYGPSFGGQNCDIFISDRCHQNRNSYANFPSFYNNGDKYVNSQESFTLFCGAKDGNQFKVRQYEVYHVIY